MSVLEIVIYTIMFGAFGIWLVRTLIDFAKHKKDPNYKNKKELKQEEKKKARENNNETQEKED